MSFNKNNFISLVLVSFCLLMSTNSAWAQQSLSPPVDSAVQAQQLININKADAKVLQKLHGLGRRRAAAIIEFRKQHGQFKTLQDLSKVKGISPRLVKKIQPQLTI